jgi:predicted metal-binding membrane protein
MIGPNLLMTLLFVAGVMNLLCVAAIAGFVLVEKLSRQGLVLGRLAGILLIAWGHISWSPPSRELGPPVVSIAV